MHEYYPEARIEGLVLQEAETDLLVYDLITHRACCLNSTAAIIWKACDGTRTISDIATEIDARSDEPFSEDVVSLGIEQLSRNRLLKGGSSNNLVSRRVSRREVVKRLGLASSVALPVVASLLAPRAVHANSACITGGMCTCTTTGMVGDICDTSVPCADLNCRCSWANNGNTMGTCVP
jgi:hypothetical protein